MHGNFLPGTQHYQDAWNAECWFIHTGLRLKSCLRSFGLICWNLLETLPQGTQLHCLGLSFLSKLELEHVQWGRKL